MERALGLLLIALLVAVVARRINVPYTVALVIVGLALGVSGVASGISLTSQLILIVFLPALLFQAAVGLDLKGLREALSSIILLAVVGVGISVLIISAVFHLAVGLPVAVALVFASMVSATDPVAVLSVFRKLGVPKRLEMIVEGESLFNDGTALVIFQIGTVAATSGHVDLLAGIGEFAMTVVGGVVLGGVCGFVVSHVMGLTTDHVVEAGMSTVLAYGSYLLGQTVGVSPVITVVVAGIVLANYGPRAGMTRRARAVVVDVWDYLAFVINSLLFLLIGMQVQLADYRAVIVPLALGIASVVLSRAVAVYGLSSLVALVKDDVPRSWRHLTFWGGLRGALSIAMVLSLPASFPNHHLLVSVTFAVVLFTILVQGLSIERVVRALGVRDS
ncbi:MAG: cation:proton antiporter [Chloroflexota bacterium]